MFTLEPHPLNFASCANIYLNQFKNITHCIALTNSNKFDTFRLSEMIPGAADNSFAEDSRLGKSIAKVVGTKLDTLFIEGAIKQPDYIKIDVDGAELSVLQGSSIVLQNAQEVQVELRKKNADQAEKFLNKLGYS